MRHTCTKNRKKPTVWWKKSTCMWEDLMDKIDLTLHDERFMSFHLYRVGGEVDTYPLLHSPL